MDERLQAYFDGQKELREKREKELRDKILIEEGLYDNVVVDDENNYDFLDYDSNGDLRHYKRKIINVTDEEFAKIKEIYESKHGNMQKHPNVIATILKVIAWVTYILGFIAGIVACAEINKYSSDAGGTTVLFTWWAAAFISGSLFLGFAEIINLLNDIKHK